MSMRSLGLGVIALALTAAAGTAAAQAPKKINVGDVAPIAADWAHFVANDKGLYAREGVDPQVTYVGNVANTVQQMVGGSFDIAVSTFDTAIRAIGNGADAVLIGGVVVKYPYSIMAAKEIGKVQDLKGKQIILPFQKDLLTIVWNRWVREQGMQPADIDQVYDGATPNRFAALTGNRVQAALLGQPFDFRAADQGYKTLLDIGAYAKDYGFLTLWRGRNGSPTMPRRRAPIFGRSRRRSTGSTIPPTATRRSPSWPRAPSSISRRRREPTTISSTRCSLLAASWRCRRTSSTAR